MNNFSDSILYVIKVVSETTTPTSQVPESICVSTTNGFDVQITFIICMTSVCFLFAILVVLCIYKNSHKEFDEINNHIDDSIEARKNEFDEIKKHLDDCIEARKKECAEIKQILEEMKKK